MKKVTVLIITCLLTLIITAAQAAEVWIRPDGPNNTGDGSAGNPYVRTNAASFDALMATIPTNSTIHLMPGTFHTLGSPGGNPPPYATGNGIPLKDQWKIRGAGIGVTIVQMDTITNPPPWAIPVFGYACCVRNDGVEISDLTIDCNLQNQPSNMTISAVRLEGSNTRVSRVKAINWGSTSAHECFIIVITGTPSVIQTNSVIDGCIIGSPAAVTFTQGASALAILGPSDAESLTNGWVVGAEIKNCLIESVTCQPPSGGVGKPAYFNGIGAANVFGFKASGNRCFSLTGGTALGSSCGSIVNAVIENNMFLDVTAGIGFAGDDFCSTNRYTKENITIIDNMITVQGGGYGMSISGFSTPSNPSRHATNVIVKNNYVGAAGAASISGINFWQADKLTFEDNIINANGGNASSTDGTTTFSSIRNNKMTDGADVTLFGAFNSDETDQTIVFNPVNGVGWYRLLKSWNRNFSSANVQIARKDALNTDNTVANNAFTDLEFNYAVRAYAADADQLGDIHLLRFNEYGAAPITQIRIGNTDAGAHTYVDVYVNNYPLAQPLLIKFSGGKNHQIEPVPVFQGTNAAAPPTKVLTVGKGLRTTGPIYAGNPVNEIVNKDGLVKTSAGGTGANNAADARSNLGLVLGTHVQPYSAALSTVATGSTGDTFWRGDGTWAPVANTVRKLADETLVSDNTLNDDSTLKFTMAANTKYTIRLKVFFTTGATPDFKYGVTGPAGATLIRRQITRAAGGGAVSTPTPAVANSYPADVPLDGTGADGFIEEEIIVHNGGTAGNFVFRWAQNTSSATQTTVLAGSYIEYMPY